MEFAFSELRTLGALDDGDGLTMKGRAMAALPLEPRLAAMIAGADTQRSRALAAEIAALVGERGLGGRSIDIRDRIERFRHDNSPRAKTLAAQAARWAGGAQPASLEDSGAIIAAAFPHLIAKRKGPAGAFQLASGRSAILDASDPLAGAEWLAVADLVGAAASARIIAATPIDEKDALQFGGLHEEEIAEFDLLSKSFRARRVKRLGAIILNETPLPAPATELQRDALIRAVQENGFELLAAGAAVAETIKRLALLRKHFGDEWPDWSADDLLGCTDEWLAPLFGTPPSLKNPTMDQVRRGLAARLDWSLQSKLAELAPLSIETPAGRKIEIDYLAEAGPLVEARVQEFYGLGVHPAIAGGRVALSVSLLSPARRQIALTKDLPAFWSGGYQDMAKDMRGRYPKHDWPADPATAHAHEGRTKARLKSEGGDAQN
ncbi:MAG: ATP-dependent helicase C-terminal domain-containing protein [Parvularculaceae bacterium]